MFSISIIFAVIIDKKPAGIYLIFKIIINEASGREGAFVLKDDNYNRLPAHWKKRFENPDVRKPEGLFEINPEYENMFVYIEEPDDFLNFMGQPEKKTFTGFFRSKSRN